MALKPAVKWAQREDKLFLTIELTDVKDEAITLTPEGKFTFAGKGGPTGQEYGFELELYGEIDVDGSSRLINANKLFFNMAKKESGPYWPYLMKEKRKEHWIKIDFTKWKDEDEDSEDEA